MAAEKFQDGGGPADEKFRKLTIAAERSMTIRADSMQRKQFVIRGQDRFLDSDSTLRLTLDKFLLRYERT
jgi:hypothetical protein